MKGLSRESRGLIDAARDGDDPSAADRKRVRSALGRKIALGAAAGAVAATASHAAAGGVAAAGASGAAVGGAGAGSAIGAGAAGLGVASGAAAGGGSIAAGAVAAGFGAKLFVSVALVGAIGAGTVGYVRHEAAKRATTEARVAAVDHVPAAHAAASPSTFAIRPRGAASPAPPSPAPVPVAKTDLAPSGVETPLAAPRPAVVPTVPASAGAPPSDLDVELALLQDAHGALRMNDGSRALRLLDEHARRFPNGALAEESEAARVFALCQVGRAAEARDVAGRFLREHPRSPLVPRVSRACDGAPSTF